MLSKQSVRVIPAIYTPRSDNINTINSTEFHRIEYENLHKPFKKSGLKGIKMDEI